MLAFGSNLLHAPARAPPGTPPMAQSSARPAPAHRLLLVRHGHYDRVPGLTDEQYGLSTLGRRQAARLGRRLARHMEGCGGALAGIFSSPWPRALQTAEITAHELGLDRVRVKPYLFECITVISGDDPLTMSLGFDPTTDEDRFVTEARLEKITDRFFRPTRRDTTSMIFAHGNLIRYLVTMACGLPLETWVRMEICHASLTELRVFPGKLVTLHRYNDTGHLPDALTSS